MEDVSTYSEREQELIADGWREGRPGPLAEEIDKPAAERYPCPDCGGPMVYRPWVKPEGKRNVWTGHPYVSYRAFAVCERCDAYSEF